MASPASPADFSLASTAVIASALIFCASRDVLARDSAEIPTKARSGARLTVASPLVTTTGTSDSFGAVVCAVAMLAHASAATAAVVFRISITVEPPGPAAQLPFAHCLRFGRTGGRRSRRAAQGFTIHFVGFAPLTALSCQLSAERAPDSRTE